MIPVRIIGATTVYRAPAGWDKDEHGHCSDLHVREDGETKASAWQPTPAELKVLNDGGSVVLHIFSSGHPPVSLKVEPRG